MPTIDLGSVVGPQGEQGNTGPQGEQGIAGPSLISASTQTTLTGVLAGDGSTVGVRAVDATPTNNSTNLVSSGGVYNKIANDVAASYQRTCNPNLFDNWYFAGGGTGDGVFPINQRAQTVISGSGGSYFIDRWKRINALIANLLSDCLQITNANWGIKQFGSYPAGTYTFSMLARKLTYPSGGAFGFNSYNTISSNWAITGNDWGLYTETVVASNAWSQAALQFNANLGNYSIEILAVKLERGNTQTLCHNEGTNESPVWVLNEVPNYAEELAKCQRYFYAIRPKADETPLIGTGVAISSTQASVVIPLPTSMDTNANHNYSYNGTVKLWHGNTIGASAPNITALGTGSISNNAITATATVTSGLTTGEACALQLRSNDAVIYISCEQS